MKRFIFITAVLFLGVSARAQTTNDPIVVLIPDSDFVNVMSLCDQPWVYYGSFTAFGNNGGTPVDSVQFTVDWGDGNQETGFSWAGNVSTQWSTWYNGIHTYTAQGIYTITVTGTSWSGGVPVDSDTAVKPGYIHIDTCSQVSGQVYLDVDNNCSFSTGDQVIPSWTIHFINTATGQTEGYAITDANGYYTKSLPTGGSYAASIYYYSSGLTYNCLSGPVHNFTLSGTHQHDFVLNHDGGFDLAVMYPQSAIALNATSHLYFNIAEFSSIANMPATVTVTLPAGITPSSCNYNYTLSGSTMTIGPVNTNITAMSFVYISLLVNPGVVQMGDQVCFDISVAPLTGDENAANNDTTICTTALNSYDPNDKHVSPQGFGPNGEIAAGQTLKYTVNFQNTGNSMAYDITVVDTIDSDFDMGSFRLDYTSHPCNVEIDGHVIAFHFDNIQLPDSNSNEPESHGFLKYSVDVPAGAAAGTEYTNTAYIFFDQNPAIVTNTTVNTIGHLSVDDETQYNVTLYPNPATDVVTIQSQQLINGVLTLTDMNGRRTLSQQMNGNMAQLNVSGMSKGMYLLEITTENFSRQYKLMVR